MKTKASVKIQLSPDSYASISSVEHLLGDVRVTGWIYGRNRKHIFAMCDVLKALLNIPSTGAYCSDEDSTDAPFSFDVRPAYIPSKRSYGHMETREELMARVQKTIRKAVREGKKHVSTSHQ